MADEIYATFEPKAEKGEPTQLGIPGVPHALTKEQYDDCVERGVIDPKGPTGALYKIAKAARAAPTTEGG